MASGESLLKEQIKRLSTAVDDFTSSVSPLTEELVLRKLGSWSPRDILAHLIGWIPVDPDFNYQDIEDKDAREFFISGADAYRLIVNDDFSRDFFPAKIHPCSETVDFQRGEVEWKGGNLYFNTWSYNMEVEYLEN